MIKNKKSKLHESKDTKKGNWLIWKKNHIGCLEMKNIVTEI